MKTRIVKTILAAVFAVASASASAEPWCHALLTATDGTEIRIDYQVKFKGYSRMPDYWGTTNVYLHVASPRLAGTEDVSIVLMTPSEWGKRGSGIAYNSVPFQDGRFTAHPEFDVLIEPASAAMRPYYSSYYVEVAAVIDGSWLKDPVTGESNFKFFPKAHPGYCANPQ